MMSYSEFISRFEVFDNPPLRKGFDRHHIVPLSEQEEPDNRQIYLTPTQHMWAHILYDREHGTKTSKRFLVLCNKPIEYFDCWGKCFAFSYTLSKKLEDRCKKVSDSQRKNEVNQKRSDSLRKAWNNSELRKKQSETSKEMWSHPEHRQKVSDSLRSNPPTKGKHWYNNGIKNVMDYSCPAGFVEGRIKKPSEPIKKGPMKEETKKKLSDINRNNPKQNSKPVQQFTKDGQFVKEYPSLMEAYRQTGISFGSIGKCCHGKRKSAGKDGLGYIWRYV